ncbi:hypothetical protein HDV00_010517 [Rhizophlyctis rosea]|nr:hypothetical protein HDV00_010517 [Rhizophlyctis rosea]
MENFHLYCSLERKTKPKCTPLVCSGNLPRTSAARRSFQSEQNGPMRWPRPLQELTCTQWPLTPVSAQSSSSSKTLAQADDTRRTDRRQYVTFEALTQRQRRLRQEASPVLLPYVDDTRLNESEDLANMRQYFSNIVFICPWNGNLTAYLCRNLLTSGSEVQIAGDYYFIGINTRYYFEHYDVDRLLEHAGRIEYEFVGVDEHIIQILRNLGYHHTSFGKDLWEEDLHSLVMLVFRKPKISGHDSGKTAAGDDERKKDQKSDSADSTSDTGSNAVIGGDAAEKDKKSAPADAITDGPAEDTKNEGEELLEAFANLRVHRKEKR